MKVCSGHCLWGVLSFFVCANAEALPAFTGGFFGAAGMTLEDHAAQSELWLPGKQAFLKADWEAGPVSRNGGEELRLKQSARVFGVEANGVTAKIENETVKELVVLFGAKSGAPSEVSKLMASLRTNIAGWGGRSAPSSEHQDTFRGKGLEITIERGTTPGIVLVLRMKPLV